MKTGIGIQICTPLSQPRVHIFVHLSPIQECTNLYTQPQVYKFVQLWPWGESTNFYTCLSSVYQKLYKFVHLLDYTWFWEGEGSRGERGGEGEGTITCRNDCRKTFVCVCVLIITNLQTCLVTTHPQNSMLIIKLSSDSDSLFSW